MQMIKRFELMVAVLFCASLAVAADTGTVTQATWIRGPMVVNTFTWTSDTADGNSARGAGTAYVRGEVLRVSFVPGTGTSAPTGTYNVVVTDTNGIDILAGKGVNLSATVPWSFRPGMVCSDGTTISNLVPFAINDIPYISVTNCGTNNRSGKIILYTR